MNTNYSQISYIATIDTNVPTAESRVDYRSDLVTEVSRKMRDAIRKFLAQDQASRFVSPSVNVHKILDAQNQEEYRNFFRAIDRYQACVAGWNSEHSVAPSASQIESAAMGVVSLMVGGAPAPNAMLLDDGTIGAYWRSGQSYASIDFEPDGEHLWAGTDGQRYWSGIWKSSSELPEVMKSELNLITC
jgi:hypothetical protein